MRALACLVVFGVGLCAAADKAVSPAIAIYDGFPAPARSALIATYKGEVKQQEKAVNAARNAIAKAKGVAAKEEAKQAHEVAKLALEGLKETNDPPYIGISMDDWSKEQRPGRDAILKEWSVGHFGLIDDELRIVQVSGKTAKLEKPMWVSGTSTYETVAGGTKTVLVIEPFDWQRYQKSLEKTETKK